MQEDKQEFVKNAFGRNIQKYLENDPRENWWYYHVSKVKTDYRLINNVGLRDKIVLNVGGFFPIDELFFSSIVKEFYSIDISPEVIEFAKKVADFELSRHLRKKLHFQVADAADLPFEDNFFDVSMSFSTLEHIPDENKRKKAFSEMARVTKKGGAVIITVPNKLSFGNYRNSVKLQNEGNCPFGYEHWYTPNELKRIMTENGLKPVFFASSAGDFSSSFRFVGLMYTLLTRKFGKRMGWVAKKV